MCAWQDKARKATERCCLDVHTASMTHEAMSWRRQVRDQEREGEQRLACLVVALWAQGWTSLKRVVAGISGKTLYLGGTSAINIPCPVLLSTGQKATFICRVRTHLGLLPQDSALQSSNLGPWRRPFFLLLWPLFKSASNNDSSKNKK